jgi:hypothetical protein
MKVTMIRNFTISLLILIASYSTAFSQVKILFDATKAETAGSADWVIDADTYNISWSSGPASVGSGSEANPARYPTPAQSGITTSTLESFWDGGISSWGIDLVKKGYTVETLPYNGLITYGNSSNLQDLSNYKVFIVVEPNILFTTTQKAALMSFVQNGGGLFMVSDHSGADRNNDGIDPPQIWNDFMDTNTVHPFGIHFDHVSISQTTTNVATLPTDTLLHGPMGNVTSVMWSAGTTMTLSTANNSTVKGIVYKTGSTTTGSTNVLVARANYGAGKVVAIGDSSPCDDGSGDSGDVLYDGWIADANGNHERLIINSTIWLATSPAVTGITDLTETENKTQLYPNPFSTSANLVIDPYVQVMNGELNIYDINGRIVNVINTGDSHFITVEKNNLKNGMYFYQLTSDKKLLGKGRFIISE